MDKSQLIADAIDALRELELVKTNKTIVAQ